MDRVFTARLLAIACLCQACNSADLTDFERFALSFATLRPPPAAPTNRFANDARAAALGQKLFFDERFSPARPVPSRGPGATASVACATCHDPLYGERDDALRARAGSDARYQLREELGCENAPTLRNAAFSTWFGWAGQSDALWVHAARAAESGAELASTREVIARVLFDFYRAEYEAIFGALAEPSGADAEALTRVLTNFGKAIEAYVRKLTDTGAPFDRWYAGDKKAMSASAVRGAKLFVGRASCGECHRGALMSDSRFHDLGLGTDEYTPRGRVEGLALARANPFNTKSAFSDAASASPLTSATTSPRETYALRTPGLRNLSRTAPYFRDGSAATLWDVLVFYREAAGSRGFPGRTDPAFQPLRLSDDDLSDLVAFLEALDGDPLPEALVTPPVLP